MASSEKALRDALRELIDFGMCAVDELRHSAYEKAETLWNESIDSGTDLERLVGWLHSRWGDYDVAGPDPGPLTSDQIRRFAIDEVLQHIADEFGVEREEESDGTGKD